ncbi:MAG TPA: glycosyltransferase family 4 protein [Solirubrobacteraceae bacterium]|nr:glycosyltransferase family 4 protein [Solirubrobacteraceae bacterium]
MNVTLVAHDVGAVGGMEGQLEALVLGLRRSGHQVTVIARTCELPPEAGISFRRVPGPRRPFLIAYPWFMLAGSLALWRWRRGVVQATGAIVLGRRLDVIAVHYLHHVGGVTPSRSTRLYRWHVKAAGALKRLAERLSYRASRAGAFVCVSDGLAAELGAHFPELGSRIVTIHNGIDTERFAPGNRRAEADALRARLGLAPGRLLAVFVGSEWERKGLPAAIRALAQAPEWDLLVAGAGDEQGYRELARTLGVERAVHWLGVARDVQPVYELADALVMPSRYETFSLVTFEAAACGLPIVASPVNGVRELIRDGENGFLIAPEPGAIAQRLGVLATDPELRARMGAEARRSVLAFHSAEMVARYARLYMQLVAEPDAARPVALAA